MQFYTVLKPIYKSYLRVRKILAKSDNENDLISE